MDTVFSKFEKVIGKPASDKELAYRWYDADRVMLGTPPKDHLRFAVAYWHSLALTGSDPFGGPTQNRPWNATKAASALAFASRDACG